MPPLKMLLSRRAKVAISVAATLVTLKGANAGWAWLEHKRLSQQITRHTGGADADLLEFRRQSLGPIDATYGVAVPARSSLFGVAHVEEALNGIKKVIIAFEKDIRDDVQWDWATDRVPSTIVNMLILNTVHERATALLAPPKDGLESTLLPDDEAIGKDAARYIRFASAAYGMLMLKGANVMSWDAGWPPVHKFSLQELNSWCIKKHCGIAVEDLVKINLLETRKLHLPGYIVAVDHATKSVVLSVRGTFSMQDTVTDLICDSAEFMGGSCHRGLRHGAEFLLEDAKDDLLRALKRNKGYRLVLCGHSLGGGVSTVLTMMILSRRKELGIDRKTEVLCYAFAPPPVFGPLAKLPAEAKRAIRAFVFGNDMVPRLSLASAYGLFRDLKEVDTLGASLPSRCRYLVREHMPQLSVSDDGRGVVNTQICFRYSTILNRSRSRGGNDIETEKGDTSLLKRRKSQHPIETFVRRKLAEEFTSTGRARLPSQKNTHRDWRAAVVAHRIGNDRYERLMIPGSVYHIRKLGETAADALPAAASDGQAGDHEARTSNRRRYWMEREDPIELSRLLMVDTAIVDHLPRAYEHALHALYGDGLPKEEEQD